MSRVSEWPSSDDDDPAWLDDDDDGDALVAAGGHRLVLEGLSDGAGLDASIQPLTGVLRLTLAWLPVVLSTFLCPFALLPAQTRATVGPGKGRNALALLCGIGAITTMLFAPLISIMSDRMTCAWRMGKRKSVLLAGVSVFALAQLVMAVSNKSLPERAFAPYAWTPDPCGLLPPVDPKDVDRSTSGQLWLVAIAFVAVVIGNCFVFVPYLAHVMESTHPAQRGLISGVMGSLFAGGLLLAVICAQSLHNLTIIGAYVVCILGFAAFVTYSATMKGSERPTPLHRWDSSLWSRAYCAPLQDSDLAWATCTRFILQLAVLIVIFFEHDFLNDRIVLPHGLTAQRATAVVLLSMLSAAVVISGLFGHMSDRIRSRRKVFVLIGIALMAATSGAMAVLRDFYTIVVFKAIFGVGYGTYLAVDFALMTDSVTTEPDRARDVAFWQNSFVVALLVARPIGGELRDGFIDAWDRCGLGYTALFVVVAGLLVVAGLAVSRARRLA
eukprot:m.135766 g.135766  ORF g.135766 m.135766 type:complete len:498 (+) comp16962_c0_seq2:633-2126(+)